MGAQGFRVNNRERISRLGPLSRLMTKLTARDHPVPGSPAQADASLLYGGSDLVEKYEANAYRGLGPSISAQFANARTWAPLQPGSYAKNINGLR
jgi:hypothetical protein